MVERGDQEFDCLADLAAELLGDLFLAFEGLGEQGGQLVSWRFGLEPAAGEQPNECLQAMPAHSLNSDASHTAAPVAPPRGAQTSAHQRPSVTMPTGTSRARSKIASRSTAFAVQLPVLVLVSGCVPHAVTMPSSFHGPLPVAVTPASPPFRVGLILTAIIGLVVVFAVVLIRDVFVGLVEVAEVRADRDVVFRDDLGEGLGDGITDQKVLLPVEDIAQQSLDDLVPARAAIVHHLGDEPADLRPFRGPDFCQAVREHAVHDRQREERPGDLQQLKP